MAAQEDIGIVRGDALDDDVFLTQRGGAADQQVEPVVRFAFGRQADGFVGIVHCVEYRGIRQFRRDIGGGFGRINMRADGDNQGVGHVFVLSGKLFDTGVSVSNISGTTDKLMGTADWGDFTINYKTFRPSENRSRLSDGLFAVQTHSTISKLWLTAAALPSIIEAEQYFSADSRTAWAIALSFKSVPNTLK